ncbi:Uncharacterised protein [Yersinia similis]|uniref:hypothetical protein n=1 Tax=Yersinia similis TaxID=367190 RepID=UPI0005E7E57B|nr:hypothetical protein [Yersinia similis]CNF47272.1 Uncharacterised protein [Yersinia similis]
MLKTCEKPKKNKGSDTTESNSSYEYNTPKKCLKTDDGPSSSTTEDSQKTKVLVVGYSPTGGGHTGRTLDIVKYALAQGTLDEYKLVVFYVPPHWEAKDRPKGLNNLAKNILDREIRVKIIESEKPVYGYLNEDGSSNDAKIIIRIALQPLYRKANIMLSKDNITEEEKNKIKEENNFLVKYYGELTPIIEGVVDYKEGDNINQLQRMTANTLIKSLKDEYKITVLSDMDPALQKAAKNHGISDNQRLDQQNHAILLDLENTNHNLNMKNAVLAKVLGGRGEKISHISLGGKNTLAGALSTLNQFGDKNSKMEDVRNAIYEKIFNAAINANDINHQKKSPYVGVVKSENLDKSSDIKNVIYIYAHNKTNTILNYIINKINSEDYKNKVFIFCGPGAIPDYNAMHLAYLIDADGITTSGAGTSGEFVYLHKNAGAKSNLLSLPIEGHNEQEKITDILYKDIDTNKHMVPKHRKIKYLEKNINKSGKNINELEEDIDELVKKSGHDKNNGTESCQKLRRALENEETYVKQAHDIIFTGEELDSYASKYKEIEEKMYKDPTLKATRKYLKLVFQSLSYLTKKTKEEPMNIYFSGKEEPIKFKDIDELRKQFNEPESLQKILGLKSKDDVESLPLFKKVRTLINSKNYKDESKFFKLAKSFGKYMTTGF